MITHLVTVLGAAAGIAVLALMALAPALLELPLPRRRAAPDPAR